MAVEFPSTTQTKIDTLKSLYRSGAAVEAYEIAAVHWPEPTGTKYYSTMPTDEVASVPPDIEVEARLIPDGFPDLFLPVSFNSSIGDEEVDLRFWDADGAMSDLMIAHGEGIKCELMYWFPQAELLIPTWQGHLRNEEAAEVDVLPIKAVQGYSSSESVVPSRAHYKECQAIFGGVFDTQAAINENDCPYNRQIDGGMVGNLDSGKPFTSCPRRTLSDCSTRLGNSLFHLSHNTVTSVVVNHQTTGRDLYSTSKGNETSLKEPVRVVMGARRIHKMEVMAYRKDLNNNDPDHGWFFALYEACEGPILKFLYPIITCDGSSQNADPQHYGYRLGTKGQSPVLPSLTTTNYSSTAHIMYGFGWVDPSRIEPTNASASVVVHGLNNIRIYEESETPGEYEYSEAWTHNRVWQIMRILADKRWGFGLDYERFDLASWIAAAEWAETNVRFTDAFGNNWDHERAMCDVELIAKKIRDQIDSICMAGRLTRPFLFNGKICIMPLAKLSSEELEAAPVFTDTGDDRNIIWDNDKTTLTVSRKSDLDLPNRIECTFDAANNNHLETTLAPIEDIDAQLRAGRVVGDHSRKVNVKKYPLLGVVVEPQALKVAWSLMDLGEFDEGGLQNNLRVKFRTWFVEALDLHPGKVIKVTSERVQKYTWTDPLGTDTTAPSVPNIVSFVADSDSELTLTWEASTDTTGSAEMPFEYFRIIGIERQENLQVEITAQAYNQLYMNSFEKTYDELPEPPSPPSPPEIPTPQPPTCLLGFGDVQYVDGFIEVPIPEC